MQWILMNAIPDTGAGSYIICKYAVSHISWNDIRGIDPRCWGPAADVLLQGILVSRC